MQSLIVYYSFTGNTQRAVEILSEQMECDKCEIRLKAEYSGTDEEIDRRTKQQIENKETPLITEIDKNISAYDTIILASPVWWCDIAPPMRTFISMNNFDNMKVYAIVTNGGDIGNAIHTIKEAIPQLNEKKALCLNFDDAQTDINESVRKWRTYL